METPTLNWNDASGSNWHFHISLSAARRLKQTQSIDLLEPTCVEILFASDPLKRIEAMAELAREQWNAAGKEYEEFADLIVGNENTFFAASAALKAGLSDFFRRLGRADLATVVDRAWEAMAAEMQVRLAKAGGRKIGDLLDVAVKRTESEIDAELDRALARMGRTTGEPSGSSPASPESIGGR